MKRIVAGVLWREGRVLICQRARGRVQELRWEFPGGKLEAGEGEIAALRRELREELGVDAVVGELVARVRHTYAETGALEVAFYQVERFSGEPVNRVFEQICWEEPSALPGFDWLEADQPLLLPGRLRPPPATAGA